MIVIIRYLPEKRKEKRKNNIKSSNISRKQPLRELLKLK